MSKGYAMIANGLLMMAKGYELLAGTGDVSEGSEIAKTDAMAQEVTEAPKPEAPKAEPKPEAPKVDVNDVRAMMRQKIKDGKMEACQEALHSFGCDKLTDVPEDKLPELLAKVEVL